MLDLSLLATVAAVVREGSFERAARVLHVTPSAVSQRVRLIEERIGTVLVVRGQPCTATEAGTRLCRHVERVALLEDGLRRELPGLLPHADPPLRATLRVAVNADSLASWFVRAMAAFSAEADVLLDVSVDDQDQTSEWLRRGHVVAAVTSQARPVQGCRARRLGTLSYVATASPRFAATWFAEGVNAESMARAPSLVFDRNDRLQDRWVRRLLRRDIALPAHRLPSPAAFIDATVEGVGWGMNPRPLVEQHLAAGRLVELVPQRPLDVPLYWQWATLDIPLLERLTRHVVAAAGSTLGGR